MDFDLWHHAYYRLPASVQQAVLVRRRTPLWIRAGIVFVHVPRAAGTSFNQALYGQFMGHVPAVAIARWGSAAVKSLPSLAITRNPWDRLLSAYRFATRGRGVGGHYQAGVLRPAQYQIPAFASFQSFVKDWLVHRDVSELDGIFQPQSAFVCDRRGRVLVDHVGRLDDLAPTFSFLGSHLGAIPTIDRSNRGGDPVDYREFYDAEMVDLIGAIYSEDIARFEYRF
jgi:hypothetical protein